MTKLLIDQLVVEVTRRCNLRCAHCLRRDARDVDLDERHVRTLLAQTAAIYSVTFTGGEPSLAVPVMRRFYELAAENGTVPSSFYVVTNGIENQLDLATCCLEMYAASDDREICGVALSVDDYHDVSRQDDVVRGLSFYRDDKEKFYSLRTMRNEPRLGHADEWVIPAGRARDNDLGFAEFSPRKNFSVDECDDNLLVDMLYLACDGRVYPDCDLSYDAMDESPGIPVEDAASALLDTLDRE